MSTFSQPLAHEVEGLEQIAEHRARRFRDALGDDIASIALPAFFLVGAAWALVAWGDEPNLGYFALFTTIYALLSSVEFEIGSASSIPTQLVFVPMLFVLPLGFVPVAVAVGSVARIVWDIARGRRRSAALPMALVNSWFSLGPVAILGLAGETTPRWGAAPVYVAAVAAQFLLEIFINAIWRRSFDLWSWPKLRVYAQSFAVDAALTPIGIFVAFQTHGRPYLLVLILPLVALLSLFAREREHRIDAALELGHAYRGTALLLGDVVDADGSRTNEHTTDVVTLTLEVADRLGLDPRARRAAEFTALLHDVGKIRVPSDIINKPGPLDPDERRIIQTHTVEGETMLTRIGGLLGEVGALVRSCHERWDGCGYPDGLAAEEIPLVARIICATDAFSAMTTRRPYREALSVRDALAELRRCAGTQFDPRVIDVLVEVVAETDKAPPKQGLLEIAAA